MAVTRLRLDLIVRRYEDHTDGKGWKVNADLWTWRLWSGSRVVSSSGAQRYSRRIDCARGAERGTGCMWVADAVKEGRTTVYRNTTWGHERGALRIIDERGTP